MSKYNLKSSIKAKKGIKIAIAISQYNTDITSALLESSRNELVSRGVSDKNISITEAPGAFELPFVCQKLADSTKYDAIIALGAIIKGETPHFDFIASAVAQGIMDIGLKYKTPVIFGVLTTNNLKQAKDRIKGGIIGDKGVEAALAALKMTNSQLITHN